MVNGFIRAVLSLPATTLCQETKFEKQSRMNLTSRLSQPPKHLHPEKSNKKFRNGGITKLERKRITAKVGETVRYFSIALIYFTKLLEKF